MERAWTERRRHVVDCDLKSFFDTVNHDRLMGALREKVRCRKTLRLIRRYLTAGVVLPAGTREATPLGVPQGRSLSPLLANIVLDPLDKELDARGHKFARYADELPQGLEAQSVQLSRCARLLVMVKSAKAASRVMASLVRLCEGRLKLVVNRAKSRCTRLGFCEFLGYTMDRRGRLVWTEKALHRFKERVREITRRNRGHRVQDVIGELRRYILGWLNSYKRSCTCTVIERLAEWVRRRVRLYYWKQWKQPRRRRPYKGTGIFLVDGRPRLAAIIWRRVRLEPHRLAATKMDCGVGLGASE